MSGAMLHGLGDCTPVLNCGCIGTGDARRPPSRAVIEAVERAEREHRWFEWCGDHPDGEFCCECGAHDTNPQHIRDEVARLTAERDALAAQVARVEALAERFDSVQEEHLLQDDCQCEMKDCYECGPWHACTHNGPPSRARQIRDALAGSESDTGAEEAGHRCEPYYSRAECGQCGWQEQWCVTCSRQMCGCDDQSGGPGMTKTPRRVEVVAQILDRHNVQDGDLFAARVIAALDAMGADQ